MPAPLADLHLHLYGTIRPDDYLDRLGQREVDWSFYEQGYEAAYGDRPPIRPILERHRAGDPAAREEFARLFVFGDEDAGNFERFQAKFNLLINGSELMALGRDPEAPARLRDEVDFFVDRMLAEQRAEGVAYTEQRLLMGNDLAGPEADPLLERLLERYARAEREGVTARLALSLDRADPWPGWEQTQRLAAGPHGAALTGIDFCFVEEGHPPREKADLFRAVLNWNERRPERALAILYHVGESFTDKSLESAVRWVQEAAELGAHRLGHAIALGVDPACYGEHVRAEPASERLDQIAYDLRHADALERAGVRVDRAALDAEARRLRDGPGDAVVTIRYDAARLGEVARRQAFAMARVRATGAVIEVCPTSNLRIGGIGDPAHHPVHRFLDAGLPVVVASDDPGIFGTSLQREIAWVGEQAGLASEERAALVDRAWRSRSEVLSGRTPA